METRLQKEDSQMDEHKKRILDKFEIKPMDPKILRAFRSPSVSIISLIANPERYQGSEVRVLGFFRCRFEEIAVYLSREDVLNLVPRRAAQFLHFAPAWR